MLAWSWLGAPVGVALLILAIAVAADEGATARFESESDRAGALCLSAMERLEDGDAEQAYEHFSTAQRIYDDLGDLANSAKVLSDMGKIQTDLSRYPQAVEHLLEALQLYESLGDAGSQMVVLNRLGIVHLELEELDNALQHFNRSLAIAEEEGDSAKIASVLGNIGIVHARSGNHQRAIECYKRSLETGDPQNPLVVAIYHNNIGVEYSRQGDYAQALEHYLQSLAMLEEVGDPQLLAEGHNNAGEAFMFVGRLREAEESMLAALRLAETSGERVTQKDCYLNLTALYEKQGRFERALRSHRRFAELRDEIFSERKSEQIAELQARFEAQQKEDEIQRLRYEGELQAIQLDTHRQTRYFLIVSVSLLAAILAILAVGYRRKIRIQRLLRDKNVQLDHLATELGRTDQLRRELVSNVSHDLRSPLAVVHGYIETLLLKDEEYNSGQRVKLLQIALDGSERLMRLVSDLFDLSRLEARRGDVEREPFLLAELVHDSVQQHELMAEKKGVALRLDIDPKAPMVEADVALMGRVLQNLLGNAVQYTPEGGEISVCAVPEARGVAVTVANSGPGIPKEDLPSVFDRYYTSKRGNPRTSGSGLGLAIVKRILDLHGIEIEVESTPGESVSFSFRVPFADRERPV